MTPDDVRAAHDRIRPWIRRTPILAAGRIAGAEVSLKLELLQHAGSFKARGAFHNLLTREVGPAGVCAASGGNHGVAVALAAARLGHPATIFVPEISSGVKVAAIAAHGARLVRGGARYADAQHACDAHARATGALLVHPYESEATVAAQGTAALEWEEDLGGRGGHAGSARQEPAAQDGSRPASRLTHLDTVLVAVGGGGLLAGVALWWGGRVKVVGVEPEGSRCLHAALEAGHPVDVPVESVAADSLGARRAGTLAFAIARERVERVVLVKDADIVAAQRQLWREFRLAVEPGGAAALAALAGGSYAAADGERVGVLVCGGNVDLATLSGSPPPP